MRLLGLICWVVIGSILLVAPLGDVIPGISWYDQQRVLQIFVIAVAGLGLLSRYWVGVERWTRSGLWLILALGGLSSLMGGALALVLDGAGNFLRFVSVGAIHGLICSAKGMGGTCYIETGNLYFCGSDSKVPGFDSLCNFV